MRGFDTCTLTVMRGITYREGACHLIRTRRSPNSSVAVPTMTTSVRLRFSLVPRRRRGGKKCRLMQLINGINLVGQTGADLQSVDQKHRHRGHRAVQEVSCPPSAPLAAAQIQYKGYLKEAG